MGESTANTKHLQASQWTKDRNPCLLQSFSFTCEAIYRPGEVELPMLCEAYHQRVADIFNNLQLAALGGALEASFKANLILSSYISSLASVIHFCSQSISYLFWL